MLCTSHFLPLFHEVILYASLYLSVSVSLCHCRCLSLCLSVGLSLCLSVCLSVSLSLCLSVPLSLCICLPAPLLCLPRDEVMYIFLSSSDSVSLSLNPSSCPSVCLSVSSFLHNRTGWLGIKHQVTLSLSAPFLSLSCSTLPSFFSLFLCNWPRLWIFHSKQKHNSPQPCPETPAVLCH